MPTLPGYRKLASPPAVQQSSRAFHTRPLEHCLPDGTAALGIQNKSETINQRATDLSQIAPNNTYTVFTYVVGDYIYNLYRILVTTLVSDLVVMKKENITPEAGFEPILLAVVGESALTFRLPRLPWCYHPIRSYLSMWIGP